MLDIQEIIQRFKEKPYLRRMSSKNYELFRCKECGSISRGRNNLNKNTNKITTVEK